MPLFSTGPAVFHIRGRHVNPSARYATSLRRDHHDPFENGGDRNGDNTMGYHGCCGVINWLYQVMLYHVKNHVKYPGISMSLLWISLGNFYNYLGFPKMECFDPTDITRPLGPSFSCRFWRAPAVLSLPSVMSTGTGKNHLQMIGNTWKYKKWLEKS